MDCQLTPGQRRFVDAARIEAERVLPIVAALDAGGLELASELRRVRQAVPAPMSALELVLAVEQLARASASLATAFWLVDVAGRFGPKQIELAAVEGLRRLLNGGLGGPDIAVRPAGATAVVTVLSSPIGPAFGVAERPSASGDSVHELSGLRGLRLTVTMSVEPDIPAVWPVGDAQRWARLAHAAVCVGVAQRALDEACQHLVDRVKMPENQPLSTFQGLRFMVADVDAAVEGARWPLYAAAAALDQVGDGVGDAVWLATTAVQLATTTALQIAGGTGFSPDKPFERLARDAWALVALSG